MKPYGYAEDDDPRWVYTFWAADDTCLYVGCTVDFPRRLRGHQLARPWWKDITRIEVAIYADFVSGCAAETDRIRALNPVHNRALTDHDTPHSLPCRRCRRSAHADCLSINRDGDPCRCGVCALQKRAERDARQSA